MSKLIQENIEYYNNLISKGNFVGINVDSINDIPSNVWEYFTQPLDPKSVYITTKDGFKFYYGEPIKASFDFSDSKNESDKYTELLNKYPDFPQILEGEKTGMPISFFGPDAYDKLNAYNEFKKLNDKLNPVEDTTMAYNSIINAYMTTYEKYGASQANHALKQLIENDDVQFFTNTNDARNILKNNIVNIDVKTTILKNIDFNNIDVNDTKSIVDEFSNELLNSQNIKQNSI